MFRDMMSAQGRAYEIAKAQPVLSKLLYSKVKPSISEVTEEEGRQAARLIILITSKLDSTAGVSPTCDCGILRARGTFSEIKTMLPPPTLQP
jgi:hypothetical protein